MTVERLMPTPYTLEMTADIWSTNTDQKLQIMEQILMMFNPSLEIQTTDNYVDWTSLSVVELENVNFSSRSIPVVTESEIDESQLGLKTPIYISPPTKVKKLGVDKALDNFKKKRPGPYKVREKFNNEIKDLKVPLLAFTHPKDNYEGLLSDWLEDIPNMKRIVISDDLKINGVKCKKKGKYKTEPIKRGHDMDQGTCFQYYNSEIKKYIKSRI